jgi:uncharacterized protein
MAAKSVTQKGREGKRATRSANRAASAKREMSTKREVPKRKVRKRGTKRGSSSKRVGNSSRGSKSTSARARKPSSPSADNRAVADAARTEVELEAAVLRRLLQHFDEHKDVQNIELMILAGFCRNCLSRWMVEAAEERGVTLDLERAREKVYGMPYSEWKGRYQPPATEEQLARFAAAEQRAAERRGEVKS